MAAYLKSGISTYCVLILSSNTLFNKSFLTAIHKHNKQSFNHLYNTLMALFSKLQNKFLKGIFLHSAPAVYLNRYTCQHTLFFPLSDQ